MYWNDGFYGNEGLVGFNCPTKPSIVLTLNQKAKITVDANTIAVNLATAVTQDQAIVVAVAGLGVLNYVTGIVDVAGNTYEQVALHNTTGVGFQTVWICRQVTKPTPAGNTITATMNAVAANAEIVVYTVNRSPVHLVTSHVTDGPYNAAFWDFTDAPKREIAIIAIVMAWTATVFTPIVGGSYITMTTDVSEALEVTACYCIEHGYIGSNQAGKWFGVGFDGNRTMSLLIAELT